MSISIVKTQIDKFLSTDSPEVMVVKGSWGIGKTYGWNKFLIEARNEGRLALKKYSYVSLFGINTLESFRYSIFENVVEKDLIGKGPSIESLKANSLGIFSFIGRKSLKFFSASEYLKDFSGFVESLSFMSIKNTIICIDDLERRGADLDIKNILGLVSHLKEQKKCKIVLILNDGEEGLEDYKKYKEKVTDIELQYALSPEECASIAYKDKEKIYLFLKQHSERLGITNIRVLKKIDSLVKMIIPLIKPFEEEIFYQVSHSVTLFSYCYYCSSKEVPSLDFVITKGRGFFGIDREELDEHQKEWRAYLLDYDFGYVDEFDSVLADAVRTGYFDQSKLISEANTNNEKVIAARSKASIEEAWGLYQNSFDNNEVEIKSAFRKAIEQNARYITPASLNSAVMLLRSLGDDELSSNLIDTYIEHRKDSADVFDLNRAHFFNDKIDEELRNKFSSSYQMLVAKEAPEDVLNRLSGQNGWNPEDEEVLASTSIDDFYRLFKSTDSENLKNWIKVCLRFSRISNASPRHQKIGENAIGALKKIGQESNINKLRVKGYGVEV